MTTRKKSDFNKFYVASPSIAPGASNASWRKATLAEAIEHATRMCEQTGKDQYIVEVIRIVKKRLAPVIVEKV